MKKRFIIECSCGSIAHALSFQKEDDTIYFHYFLESVGFFKRCLNAIKYIFGHKSKYGDFGETLIEEETAKQLIVFLEDFVKGLSEENGAGTITK